MISQKTESLNGVDATYDYEYDSRGRLTTVTKDNQVVESYTYDANGNRVSATVNGVATSAYYTLDDQTQVYGSNTYAYDEDGQLVSKQSSTGTTTYSYNTYGTLTDATLEDGTTIKYHLNPLNQRVAKEVDGVITEKYLWKDLTTLLAIYDKDDNLVQRYNYTDERVPTSLTQDNQTYYLHYDQVGTLRLITDAQNQIVKEITYDTFGNILTDTNSNFKIPFGFAGGLHDRDTNLVHFGHREYDPYTAKWTTKDPIDFSGGDTNLYGYVLNDPVNFVDPEGLYIWSLLTPTEMGPNTIITVDKNGNKSIYDLDTGKTKPYWDNKKLYCETGKDDGSDRELNRQLQNSEPNRRPPASRPSGNRINNLLEIFGKIAEYF